MVGVTKYNIAHVTNAAWMTRTKETYRYLFGLLQVEIVGLMPPKPSPMLLKSTTTVAPSTASDDLLLENDDEYEEETAKPNSSSAPSLLPSLVNENYTLNETI